MKTSVRGRAHVFGADLDMDTDVLPHKYAALYPFEGDKLRAHLFEEVRPGFANQVQPGDVIVAGANFCKGKPHPQALIAMAELGLSVLCESMPFATYRGAISRGILCHRNATDITSLASDGDIVAHNYLTGTFVNESTGVSAQFAPLPERLLEMMALGGMKPMLAAWAKAKAEAQQE